MNAWLNGLSQPEQTSSDVWWHQWCWHYSGIILVLLRALDWKHWKSVKDKTNHASWTAGVLCMFIRSWVWRLDTSLFKSTVTSGVALSPNPDLSPSFRTYMNIISYVNTAEYCFRNNLIRFSLSFADWDIIPSLCLFWTAALNEWCSSLCGFRGQQIWA